MNIGIDIDNTITEVEEELDEAAYKYAISIGKNVNEIKEHVKGTKNNGDEYKERFGFTYEELKYFLKDIQEEILNKAKPRANAVETIKKLRQAGNKIFIITARDSEFHDDPYMLSKSWLDKNKIEYDKLIVDAREKGSVCRNEKIDIFIDDQLNNCLEVARENIKVIRINNEDSKNKNIIDLTNWNEIYQYIQGELNKRNEEDKR